MKDAKGHGSNARGGADTSQEQFQALMSEMGQKHYELLHGEASDRYAAARLRAAEPAKGTFNPAQVKAYNNAGAAAVAQDRGGIASALRAARRAGVGRTTSSHVAFVGWPVRKRPTGVFR